MTLALLLTLPSGPVRRVGALAPARSLWAPRPTYPAATCAPKLAGSAAAVLPYGADVVDGAPPVRCEVAPRAAAPGGTQ